VRISFVFQPLVSLQTYVLHVTLSAHVVGVKQRDATDVVQRKDVGKQRYSDHFLQVEKGKPISQLGDMTTKNLQQIRMFYGVNEHDGTYADTVT